MSEERFFRIMSYVSAIGAVILVILFLIMENSDPLSYMIFFVISINMFNAGTNFMEHKIIKKLTKGKINSAVRKDES